MVQSIKPAHRMERFMNKLENAATKESGKRPKQPLDSALAAPIVLTLDQIEEVAAGFSSSEGGGHTTTGVVAPPPKAF
jgi:hypothetical protein